MYDIKSLNIWKQKPEANELNADFYEISIADLNLSVRSFNCLKRAGCDTVGQILSLISEDENGLRKIRNLGSRSEAEILECIRQFKEDYSKESSNPVKPRKKLVLYKPSKSYWNAEIETFHLSDYALTTLKQHGIRYVKDLYTTDLKQEPGWYAVRELFEKIPL